MGLLFTNDANTTQTNLSNMHAYVHTQMGDLAGSRNWDLYITFETVRCHQTLCRMKSRESRSAPDSEPQTHSTLGKQAKQ